MHMRINQAGEQCMSGVLQCLIFRLFRHRGGRNQFLDLSFFAYNSRVFCKAVMFSGKKPFGLYYKFWIHIMYWIITDNAIINFSNRREKRQFQAWVWRSWRRAVYNRWR